MISIVYSITFLEVQTLTDWGFAWSWTRASRLRLAAPQPVSLWRALCSFHLLKTHM